VGLRRFCSPAPQDLEQCQARCLTGHRTVDTNAPTTAKRTSTGLPASRLVRSVVAAVGAVGITAAGALVLSVASAASPVATGARTMPIHEVGTLRLASHQGTKILHEQGQASGTFRGTLTANININYTQAKVGFTISPAGGSIYGEGLASYYVSGKTGHFNGNVAINHGTGRYAHIRSSEVHISGLIKRAHYELSLQVSGSLRE